MHFQFGFEESFGFLSGRTYGTRTPVVAAMLAAEMAAVARDRGMTLYDWLQDLFRPFRACRGADTFDLAGIP
jgi:phosphoglucomutase